MANRPFIVGLTGSIGMGKTETAKMFAKLGVPVYDSDAAVHGLYEKGGAAVPAIEKRFRAAVKDGARRPRRARRRRHRRRGGVQTARGHRPSAGGARADAVSWTTPIANGADMVVLDIPLLFETGGDARMDAVVVVSAPSPCSARARAGAPRHDARKSSTTSSSRQMPDAEKRAKAHFVIVTDKGLDHAFEQVKMIVAALHETRAQRKSRMREIVLDTETTGLDPADGHRIIEIGCVELMDHLPTGRIFTAISIPSALVPVEAQRVHGISDEFLAGQAAVRRHRR